MDTARSVKRILGFFSSTLVSEFSQWKLVPIELLDSNVHRFFYQISRAEFHSPVIYILRIELIVKRTVCQQQKTLNTRKVRVQRRNQRSRSYRRLIKLEFAKAKAAENGSTVRYLENSGFSFVRASPHDEGGSRRVEERPRNRADSFLSRRNKLVSPRLSPASI